MSQCVKCLKTFRDKSDLDRHLSRLHPCDKDGFTCESCNKIFTRKDNLVRHLKTCTKHEKVILSKESHEELKNEIAGMKQCLEQLIIQNKRRGRPHKAEKNITYNKDCRLDTMFIDTVNLTTDNRSINNNAVNIDNRVIINIHPWEKPRLKFTAKDINETLEKNRQIMEFTMFPKAKLEDEKVLSQIVPKLFTALAIQAHKNPNSQNIHINPKSIDQVFVFKRDGVLDMTNTADAITLIFDDVADQLSTLFMKPATFKELSPEVMNAFSIAKIFYRSNASDCVRESKALMAAHFSNLYGNHKALDLI